MPEGDTVYQAASALRKVLAGRTVERADGTNPAVRAAADRLAGTTVTEVRTRGKHLFVDFDSGMTIRTHLGMPGSWHVYRPDERWRRPPGAARVILTTADAVAVCFSAPDIEVERRRVVDRAVAGLGPDLALPQLNPDEVLRRAELYGKDRTVANVLVDQRVMAGAGNVYKSETLFLEGLLPTTPLACLDARARLRLVDRAHRLLQANLSQRVRSTTGDRRRGRELWVYGRSGRPCRRCGTLILEERVDDRPTFWCPTCQS